MGGLLDGPGRGPPPRWGGPRRRLSGSATGRQGAVHGGERLAGALAQGRDGRDADDDDEGEHDRVLDRGRAVLGLDELHNVLGELTHDESPVWWCESRVRDTTNQLPAGSAAPTLPNVSLALWPSVVTAPMQTTMMRASMTAYSTAVGPSSALTNFTTLLAN